MKIVYVEWIDSATTFGWQDPDKDGTVRIRSTGWLVNQTPRTLTLSTCQSKFGRVLDQINIPRFAVKKFKVIGRYPK